jgi:hypothetical protein
MQRGDEVEAEADVVFVALRTGTSVTVSCSDESMVVLTLRRAADKYERYLREGKS